MEKPKIPVDLILTKLAEDAEKARTRVQKASDVLLQELDTGIAQTPYEIVYEEDRVKLKYYQPTGPAKLKRPLLVVYALINRETMLDLQPGKSVIQNFLDEGVEVYLIDWGYPTRKDRYLTLDQRGRMANKARPRPIQRTRKRMPRSRRDGRPRKTKRTNRLTPPAGTIGLPAAALSSPEPPPASADIMGIRVRATANDASRANDTVSAISRKS